MITVEQVVGAALQDRTILDQLGEALSSDLVVANPLYRRVVEFANEFALQYRKLPRSGDWELWLSSLGEQDREAVRESLGRLLAQDTSNFEPGYFGKQVLEELRQTAAQTARARLNALQHIEPDTFRALWEQIERVQAGTLEGLADLSEIDLWAQPLHEEETTPTGFPKLDEAIGGWGEELVIVFADSGVGKSMLLQNFGALGAQKGKNVLHISLELSLRPMIHRYYRQIAQVDRGEFRSEPDKLKSSLRHWFRFAKGSVHLIEFPAYSTDPEQLHRVIDRVDRLLDGGVDMVILDYMDLLTLPQGSRGRGSTYEDLNKITHLVRSYCSAFGSTVLTASQAVRRPERSDRLSVRDMGDSYGKVRGADVLLSLVQTEEELEVHQGRIGVLKVREYGGLGREVPVYINRDLAMIAELNHPNTIELMRRLGHLRDGPTPGPMARHTHLDSLPSTQGGAE